LAGWTTARRRQEKLSQLHLMLQPMLRTGTNLPELRPTFELCTALDGLLRKFKNDPRQATAPRCAPPRLGSI